MLHEYTPEHLKNLTKASEDDSEGLISFIEGVSEYIDIVEGIIRVMGSAPGKKTREDGLPVPPYSVYNIGEGTREKPLDYISTLQEELVRAGVLPEDYDFAVHKTWLS